MPPAGPTKTGSPGTYNYLIDAVLAVPRTRQMYMRRLRTLMDTFMATGRLQASGCQSGGGLGFVATGTHHNTRLFRLWKEC